MKHVWNRCFCLLFAAALVTKLTGCGVQSESVVIEGSAPSAESQITAAEVQQVLLEEYFTNRELSGEYDATEATSIELSGESITITQGGTYLLTGSIEDGMITVDVSDSEKVQLVLCGVEISNSSNAAVYIKEADKVFITLAEGSVNRLSSESYTDLDGNHIDGCIFSKADLAVNGTGSLEITAEEGHGIVSKDDLVITGGELHITAVKDCLTGKDGVRIGGGTLVLDAGDDGIHSDEQTAVYAGSIGITECYEGIEGKQVTIAGGTVSICASDDGLNATEESILISGGTISIDAQGDGIDSNGDLLMTGGEVFVSGPVGGANGALDYDGTAQITGGRIIALDSGGMAVNFGDTSTQGSILLKNQTGEAGTEIILTDESGTVLFEFTAQKAFNAVVISCPELQVGGTYTITVGEESTQVTLESVIYGEGFSMGQPGGGQPGQRPEGAPDGQDRPEDASEGQDKPEGAPDGQDRPEGAPEGQDRPEGTPEGQDKPESAPVGQN